MLELPGGNSINVRVQAVLSEFDVCDVIYSGRPARVLYGAETRTAQSGLAKDDQPELLFDYMERFMELVRGQQPASILLIGGGAFVLPRAIQMEFPGIELTIVEIDEQLPQIAEQYFDFRPNQTTHVVSADGLSFLEHDTHTYDLILLDVYDVQSRSTVPRGFQTQETAGWLKARLSAAGILAYNIIAAYQGDRSAALRRQIASLDQTFPALQLFPASYRESEWLSQNFILTAQARYVDLSALIRYAPLPLPSD